MGVVLGGAKEEKTAIVEQHGVAAVQIQHSATRIQIIRMKIQKIRNIRIFENVCYISNVRQMACQKSLS